MNKKDILIRLLKQGHVNEEEFKLLYEEPEQVVVKEFIPYKENIPEWPFQIVPNLPMYPIAPWLPTTIC